MNEMKKLFLAGILLGAIACAQAAGEKPFTPAEDLKGDWGLAADPKLPNVLLIGDSISIGDRKSTRLNSSH